MSRSGYNEDVDCDWALIRWRGAVTSAIRGKRGQAMLIELASALDAMPEKKLIANSLQEGEDVCALGCLGRARGIDMSQLDPEEPEQVASKFGIAPALAREIVWINDDCGFRSMAPEQRWAMVRKWVDQQIFKG